MLDLRILQIYPADEPYKAYMVIDKGLIEELLKCNKEYEIAVAEAERSGGEAERAIAEAKSAVAEAKSAVAEAKSAVAEAKSAVAEAERSKANKAEIVYGEINFKEDIGDYYLNHCATYSVEDDGNGIERTNCLFKHLEEFYINDNTPDILDRRKILVDSVLMDSAEFSNGDYSAIEQDVGYATKIFLYDLEPPNKDIPATGGATSEAATKEAVGEPVAEEAPLNYIFLVKRYKSEIDLSEELEIVVLNYEPESYYPVQKYAGISSSFGKIRTAFSELENSGVMLIGTQPFDISNFFRQNYLKFYYIEDRKELKVVIFSEERAKKLIVAIYDMIIATGKTGPSFVFPVAVFREYVNELDPKISLIALKGYLRDNDLIRVNDNRLDYNIIDNGKQQKVIFFKMENLKKKAEEIETEWQNSKHQRRGDILNSR